MKSRMRIAMMGLLAFFLLAWMAAAADVSGFWKGAAIVDGANHAVTFKFRSDGNKLTGSITGAPPKGEEQQLSNGKIDGDQLYWETSFKDPEGDGDMVTLTYKAKVKGNQINGIMSGPHRPDISFSATKQ